MDTCIEIKHIPAEKLLREEDKRVEKELLFKTQCLKGSSGCPKM